MGLFSFGRKTIDQRKRDAANAVARIARQTADIHARAEKLRSQLPYRSGKERERLLKQIERLNKQAEHLNKRHEQQRRILEQTRI